jgi:hypothetical protein
MDAEKTGTELPNAGEQEPELLAASTDAERRSAAASTDAERKSVAATTDAERGLSAAGTEPEPHLLAAGQEPERKLLAAGDPVRLLAAGDAATAADEAGEGSSRLGQIADAVESAAGTVAEAVADHVGPPLASIKRGAGQLASGAARRLEDRPGARERRLRRQAREALPVLWQEHPDAVNATRRDMGLVQVPLEQIRGTAVEGAQRGGDFRPIPRLRGSNWEGRWRRIKTGMNRMESLPPIDVLQTGDDYWVLDGHNRVAAAKYLGQDALDASVVQLRLPGQPRSDSSTEGIGQYLADDMREVRAAGEGRHSRTAGLTMDLAETESLRRAFEESGANTEPPTPAADQRPPSKVEQPGGQ